MHNLPPSDDNEDLYQVWLILYLFEAKQILAYNLGGGCSFCLCIYESDAVTRNVSNASDAEDYEAWMRSIHTAV